MQERNLGRMPLGTGTTEDAKDKAGYFAYLAQLRANGTKPYNSEELRQMVTAGREIKRRIDEDKKS